MTANGVSWFWQRMPGAGVWRGIVFLLAFALAEVSSASVICCEAEWANDLTYPFEIAQVADASGWALCTDDGAGGEAEFKGDMGVAAFNLTVPQAGRYYVWLRAWWMNECGNSVYVQVGKNVPALIETNVMQQWHWVRTRSWALPAGSVQLRIMNREDGFYIDQVILTDEDLRLDKDPMQPNVLPYAADPKLRLDRAFVGSVPSELAAPPSKTTRMHGTTRVMGLERVPTFVVREKNPTSLLVWLRNNEAATMSGKVLLATNAPITIEPGVGQEFQMGARMPLSTERFRLSPTAQTPRGEFPLSVLVQYQDGRTETQEVLVMRPFQWLVTNAVDLPPSQTVGVATSLDANLTKGFPGATKDFTWRVAGDEATTRYGLLDMRRAVADKWSALAYAYTSLESPNDGEYYLDIRHDDQVRFWLNGVQVFASDASVPSGDTRRLVKVRLRKGANDLLVKLAQRDGKWEFQAKVRTLDGKPSQVYGREVAGLLSHTP